MKPIEVEFKENGGMTAGIWVDTILDKSIIYAIVVTTRTGKVQRVSIPKLNAWPKVYKSPRLARKTLPNSNKGEQG